MKIKPKHNVRRVWTIKPGIRIKVSKKMKLLEKVKDKDAHTQSTREDMVPGMHYYPAVFPRDNQQYVVCY